MRARKCASSSALQAALTTRKQMVAEIRHHQIVENAAITIGELRVALPPGRDSCDVPCGTSRSSASAASLDLAGLRPQRELAHMRDVEQAGCAARVLVFPQQRRLRIATGIS